MSIRNLGLEIGPEFTLDEFKSNSNFKDFKYLGGNDGYERFNVPGIIIDNSPFGATLIFYKNKISLISICYAQYKHIPDEGWKKQKEIADSNRKKHDDLMREQHGATSIKYQWGSIGSFLDERFVYNANIIIRYNWSDRTDPTFVKSMPPNMRQKLIIDENGHIDILSLKLVITPQLTTHDVENDSKSSSFKYLRRDNTDFQYYELGSLIIDQLIFKITLSFNFRTKLISKVWMTYFGFIGNKTVGLTPQETNSTKHFHDEWVLGLKGGTINKIELPQGKFVVEATYPWGTVTSTLGRKNIPEILLIYKNQ